MRIARHQAPDLGAARAHLRYIQRDGVTRDGKPGRLFGRDTDDADGAAFLERSEGERHQFRLTISAQDSHQLADLKPVIRDLMHRVEQDLDTKLDWVAVDHFNTGHPHTHIVVRGKTEMDNDLVIARSYISHGIRWRAEQLVTMELGPETELERFTSLQRDVTKQRYTRLDRAIVGAAKHNVLAISTLSRANVHATFHQARLKTLEQLRLAEEVQTGVWSLAPDLTRKLRDLGERFDRIKTIDRVLARNDLDRAATRFSLFNGSAAAPPVIGRVLGTGPVDELTERRYLVLDGIDGRIHYAEFNAKHHDLPKTHHQILALTRTSPRNTQRSTARVSTLSHTAVSNLARYEGPTWLDRLTLSSTPPSFHQGAFGQEVERALIERREWLVTNGYAQNLRNGALDVKPRLLDRLAVQEWKAVGARLEKALGATYRPAQPGQTLSGIYERPVIVPDGQLAVISRPDGFALVRWRHGLEKYRGRHVSGTVHARTVTWHFNRNRNLPSMR